ncbi:MAG TPA: alpha/beta hydrolase family protein [Gemmatimonadaceae bacterium]|nr:alpha/beta hydrolase family protein [Gemmatimonadaceae bacterium]
MLRRRSDVTRGLRLLLLLASAAVPLPAQRGTVDTATFWSQALGTNKRYVVYLPPSYTRDTARHFPVAYYLHGGAGDETNWTARGQLDRTLDSLIASGLPEMIVVMPDGDMSYYTTWNFLGDYQGCLGRPVPRRPDEKPQDYCVPWPHYDDYIARDLVKHVDSTYRTQAERKRRAIAGLSMGGYGAMSLAFNYPEVFAAAASHSGAVAPLLIAYDSTTKRARYATDPEQVLPSYGAQETMRLAFGRDTSGWWARDPGRKAVFQASRNDLAQLPAIYIDVGTEDRLLGQSRAFRDVIEGVGIRPVYVERSGAHDWSYWRANAAHSVTFLAKHLTQP